ILHREVMFLKRMIVLLIIFVLYSLSMSKVLLLYKGSENGYGQSIFKNYVIPYLKNMNEDYELIDVEKEDLPYLNNYSLVVTVYYTPDMKDAKIYLKKMSDYLALGGKLLIINNMGAFSDKAGNNPTLEELNALFNLLGVNYSYGWKEVKVRNYIMDRKIMEKKVEKIGKRPVENYVIFSPVVKVIQKAVTEGGTYPVGFYGKRGGILLFNHAFDENGIPIIKIGKVVEAILTYSENQNEVLVLGKNDNVEMAFKNALFVVKQKKWGDLSRFKAIIYVDGSYPVKDMELLSYVTNGGILVLVSRGNSVAKGKAVFLKDMLNIPRDISIETVMVHYYVPLADYETFLKVGNDDVGWVSKYGSGKIIYFPKELLGKDTRGYLFNVILRNSPALISPIVNSYTVFLDDFPLPAYGVYREQIVKEFGNITDGEFYYNIWWKDIKEIAEKLNIKYTSALVTNYNVRTDFYSFAEFLATPYPSSIVRELMNDPKIEVGLHGYNHLPPVRENWRKENLINAYKALSSFMENFFEDFKPVSFVAPNNKIDEMGIEALKDVFPSIQLIGTDYTAKTEFSEFKIKNGVAIVPRTTSGYYPIDRLISSAVSAILNFGTFQYFIHPDDLFAADRNSEGLSWKEMKKSMEEFLTEIKAYYPWLNNHFGYEEAMAFKDYFETKPAIIYDDNKIKVILPKTAYFPRYFYLKFDGEFFIEGGKVIYKDKGIYIIEMDNNVMEIERL
ncbi:MAG: DUF2194 domain-containing protein, partial [Thermotogaceae bacterium]|nr:DUF2194 domain-containing protein [Thermotogaceae bacterium]